MPFLLTLVSIKNYFNCSNLEKSILLIYIYLDVSFKMSLFQFLERKKKTLFLAEADFFLFFSTKKHEAEVNN